MTDLTPENNYQFPPTPAAAMLGREAWNAVMASLSGRLVTLENKRSELQDLIDDLSFNGQQRLDEAIGPLIEAQELELEALTREIVAMQQANATIINDFQEVTAVNLQDLAEAVQAAENSLVDVQSQINIILAGGLAAAMIEESATRVFVTPEQKSEIGQLRTDLGALADDLDGGTFT